MSGKMKDILVRSASGLVLIAVVFGATLASRWSFGALLALLAAGCVAEFYKLCRHCGSEPLRVFGTVITLAVAGLGFAVFMQFGEVRLDHNASEIILGLLLFLLLAVPMVFVCELRHNSPTPINNIATTLMGVTYVGIPFAMMPFIPLLLNKGEWSGIIMLCYIALIWVNDVFAYLVGIAIGRRRMCERISPKKSWEGFFGGLAGAIGAGVLCGWWLGQSMFVWGGLGLVVAVSGVAGDFIESLFKRSAGVKDSGAILPGHGGFLDRFDALLMSLPFAFVYLLIVWNC